MENSSTSWHLSVWFFLGILALGLFLIPLIFTAIEDAIKGLRTRYLRLTIHLANSLYPSDVEKFRNSVSTTLEEISQYVEKTQVDSAKTKLQNTYLKEKIEDLEKARKALIEELSGGTTDYINLEFEIYQSMSQTIEFLFIERMRLLRLVDAAVSFSGGQGIGVDGEDLLKANRDLDEELQAFQQESSEKIRILQRENSDVRQSKTLLQGMVDTLTIQIDSKDVKITNLKQQLQRSTIDQKKIFTLEFTVKSLETKVRDLEFTVASKILEIGTLESTNESLGLKVDDWKAKFTELENKCEVEKTSKKYLKTDCQIFESTHIGYIYELLSVEKRHFYSEVSDLLDEVIFCWERIREFCELYCFPEAERRLIDYIFGYCETQYYNFRDSDSRVYDFPEDHQELKDLLDYFEYNCSH
ncbi:MULTISPECIES: coiled-coil domain-containing protein [Cyanophyceae]|uniref:Uncharacterized protein n=1 Tax=Leptolyngbya subtilissima DQ-A4 TaxID=2933933 RepID=A0ABV0JZG4_9CYAN|nr:hypothetical protein [Nodosilinea sp. FACHB-141]MBD2112548.1 hypothetical protein [Nodosilinea sp. FACHB-141]